MSLPQKQIDAEFMLKQLMAFAKAWHAQRRPSQLDISQALINSCKPESCKVDSHLLSKLMAQRACGESYGAIAFDLNRRGVRGAYGARWYASSVRVLLQRVANQDNLIL